MLRPLSVVTMIVGMTLASVASAGACPDELMAVPKSSAPVSGDPVVSAESRFNEGLALAEKKDWARAEKAYREAIKLRAEFPEAWNGLGYALRQQKKYDESVKSYQEALRLRPDYPQAIEYLGEAYVRMGRMPEARRMLERLRALDPEEANELAETIAKHGG
jgi:tetratricopeptide (TPR) repeat protein